MQKIKILLLSLLLVLSLVVMPAYADPATELNRDMKTWVDDVNKIIRMDCEGLERMWEIACGADIERNEPDEINTVEKEINAIADKVRKEEAKIDEHYKKLLRRYDDWKKINKSNSDLDKQKNKITNTNNKVKSLLMNNSIKGAQHPSVQLAIEYGKKMHDEMGENNKCTIYDEQITSGKTRPDCVFIGEKSCHVYEFKPDNSAAKNKGNSQLAGYRKEITYDKIKSFLDDEKQEIVKKYCMDGNVLKFEAKSDDLKTYKMCDKTYKCVDKVD